MRDHRRYALCIIIILLLILSFDWRWSGKISIVSFYLWRQTIPLFHAVWFYNRIYIICINCILCWNWSYHISLNSGALNSLNIIFRAFFIFKVFTFQKRFITQLIWFIWWLFMLNHICKLRIFRLKINLKFYVGFTF